MTDQRRPFSRLSNAEAQRALYIDFEGEKGKCPVLLGVLRRRGGSSTPRVQQDILDETFAPLATPATRLRSLHDVVLNVVQRAEHADRRIVSWSEHDLGVVRTLRDEDPGLVVRFEARYANALSIARRWRNRVHGGDKPSRGQLGRYLELITYPVPADAGPGHVGTTIRLVRPRLERGLPPTDTQQERWERLLDHNRHDCAGMREVCVIATRELEAVVDAARGDRPARRRRSGGTGRRRRRRTSTHVTGARHIASGPEDQA
jgi:hypothetical protein